MKAKRSERFILAAQAVVFWERVWPALWPASGILGLFIAAALLGLPPLLPWPLHALLLAAVVTLIGLSLYFTLADVRLPDWQDGARRLERDSTLTHRPISESQDVLLAGADDAWAQALWRAHVRRRLADIAHLRLDWPRSDLPRRDPGAWRIVVLLLILGGLVVAGGDWSRRLGAAFGPGSDDALPVGIDAWVDPPPYTGEPPIYLAPQDKGPVVVPAGSLVHLRVHGAGHTPSLSTGDAFKGARGEYESTVTLNEDTDLRVRAGGRTIGDWRLRALADQKPVIAFASPPARTEHEALKLAFTAGDDYGVASVHAVIRPHGRYGKPLIVELPLDSTSAKTLSQTSFTDLTAHPYAGLDVDIVLEATDGAGQTGTSKPARTTLPARIFTDALSRALIEQRQSLGTGDVRARDRVARTLDALALAPERFYQDKMGVYVALRAAYWGLVRADHAEDYTHVQDLLWQIAVGLERGGLLSAAEELRRLQQMLSQALAQGAPQPVIVSLLQRYREALQRYLQALAQNPPDSSAPPAPGSKVLSQQDLETLLKAIEQMAQNGARGDAAQMLALLQSLLENLRMTGGGGGGSSSPADKALNDTIQGLGDLMGKQRALLDKTFRQFQGKPDPKDGGPKGLSRDQRTLHDELNKALKGLEGQKVAPPKSLGDAGKSMGEAEGDLGNQNLPGAGADEKSALEALRKGAADLAKTLMSRSGQQGQQGETDPLGRSQGATGGAAGGNIKMPDMTDLQRARNILKELRKRAAERGRPQEELDYIDRLLKQF